MPNPVKPQVHTESADVSSRQKISTNGPSSGPHGLKYILVLGDLQIPPWAALGQAWGIIQWHYDYIQTHGEPSIAPTPPRLGQGHHLLEPCPTLPFYKYAPVSEQRQVWFPSNFGTSVLLSQRGGGWGCTLLVFFFALPRRLYLCDAGASIAVGPSGRRLTHIAEPSLPTPPAPPPRSQTSLPPGHPWPPKCAPPRPLRQAPPPASHRPPRSTTRRGRWRRSRPPRGRGRAHAAARAAPPRPSVSCRRTSNRRRVTRCGRRWTSGRPSSGPPSSPWAQVRRGGLHPGAVGRAAREMGGGGVFLSP